MTIKAKKEKKSKPVRRGRESKFNLEDDTRTWLNPKTKQIEALPPLQGVVDDLLPFTARWELISTLCPRYGCSKATVDRAIARAKEGWAAEMAKKRRQRIMEAAAKLDSIAKAAKKDGQYQAAKGAIMDKAKLAGDFNEQLEIGPIKNTIEEMTDDELAAIIKKSKRR